ncbi:MAG: HD domain-containing protein [Armatimonadetes bacterium]|nr:HD domain-containing protein [Armatimonadota bacterium]
MPMSERTTLARQEYAVIVGRQLAAARGAAFAGPGPDCRPAMEQYVSAVDAALGRIFRWSFGCAAEGMGLTWDGDLAGVAVVAVGGYGRFSLAPYSDLDVAVVAPDGKTALTQTAITHAYHILNDAVRRGLGVEYGYAYYELDEPFDLDERTLSALLDSRLVGGAAPLMARLDDEVFRQLEGPLFLRWNAETRRQAREQAGGVVHVQEPDLKHSAGGLRDLQCALWSASAVWRRKPAEMLGYLMEAGEIAEDLAREAQQAQDFVWTVRSRLHLLAGRKRDVLSLDAHEQMARALGFVDAAGNPDPAALMARYYANAERLAQLSRQIAGLCEASRIGVGDGYYVHEGALWTRNAPRLRHSAGVAMHGLELALKYGVELSRPLARSMEGAAPIVREQGDSPQAAASFLSILKHGPRAARVLRAAQESGVLQAYVPELGRVMRMTPGEQLHQFTVGEHLLRTVERLGVLTETGTEPFEHHAEVYAELDRPEVLVLAALLHDVGRIDASGDHCEVGEEIALRTARRLGIPEPDALAVGELVRKHLLLERVATMRDVSDEVTLHHVAAQVGTVECLKRLYLLTCADIMAVGPGLWTDVRRDQLEGLYFAVLAHLLEDAPRRGARENISRLRERTIEALLQTGKLPPEATARHCRLMPDDYILGTPAGLVGVHINLIEKLAAETTVIDVYNTDNSRYTELTVVRHDDALPGLFSRLCAALYANDADIHNASIYTRMGEHAIVVDSLWVSWRGQPIPERRAQAICADLREVLDGGVNPEDLLARKNRPRPRALGIDLIEAHNDWSDRNTVFEVTGRDQIGFLYCVTAAFAQLGLNISTAKINTRGARAEDAFYVTNAAGERLSDAEALAMETELLKLLTGDPGGAPG